MNNIKENAPGIFTGSRNTNNILPRKEALLKGTKVKINCTYNWQSNIGVIVEKPADKAYNIHETEQYGQWIDNGNYVAHFPYCRFEELRIDNDNKTSEPEKAVEESPEIINNTEAVSLSNSLFALFHGGYK